MYVIDDPERLLALTYAPAGSHEGLRLLWALDARLGNVVRQVREPLLAEVRLTWWRDALAAVDTDLDQRDPILRDLAKAGLPAEQLSSLAEGWADLLQPAPIDNADLEVYAIRRGGGLFVAAGRALGSEFDGLTHAGAGWALVDLAGWIDDADTSHRALRLALPRLENAFADRWPKQARPMGMLAVLALRDARAGYPPRDRGSPARQLRMLRHRFTGR
jgi:phytoene synthase